MELNPEKRMTHEEFYEYVNSEEFMRPNAIYKKNIYRKDYEEINSKCARFIFVFRQR